MRSSSVGAGGGRAGDSGEIERKREEGKGRRGEGAHEQQNARGLRCPSCISSLQPGQSLTTLQEFIGQRQAAQPRRPTALTPLSQQLAGWPLRLFPFTFYSAAGGERLVKAIRKVLARFVYLESEKESESGPASGAKAHDWVRSLFQLQLDRPRLSLLPLAVNSPRHSPTPSSSPSPAPQNSPPVFSSFRLSFPSRGTPRRELLRAKHRRVPSDGVSSAAPAVESPSGRESGGGELIA